MDAFHARDPHIPSKEILEDLPQPLVGYLKFE